MRPRRRSDLVPVGRTLPRVLRDLGLAGTPRLLRIRDVWETAVGAPVAEQAEPAGLVGDVLEVRVTSSAWSQQLQLRSPQILAALREALGDEAPSRLRLRIR